MSDDIIPFGQIQYRILSLRGHRVLLDRDLAAIRQPIKRRGQVRRRLFSETAD
jgi:hypothetical protein